VSRLHAGPRKRAVLAAQLETVGIALRWPITVAGALLTLASLFAGADIFGNGEVLQFHPERSALPGLVGALFPIAVWRNEDRFGNAYLWTLPVDRFRHALIRVLAGWAWLMGVVALFVIWLLALTLTSGTTPFAEEMQPVLLSFAYGATYDASAIQSVRWMPHPLLWLVPFTSATGTYVLASALALGVKHPLRWLLGSVLGFFLFLMVVSDLIDQETNGLDRLLNAVVNGRYGLDALLTARTETLQVAATLTNGEQAIVWRGFPDAGHWAIATLAWTGAGLVLLVAAAARHRERRRT
jgi:hypothetical protein